LVEWPAVFRLAVQPIWEAVMFSSKHRYSEESEALQERWRQDNEGLHYPDFFEKYASQGFKEFHRERREYRERMLKKGIVI
jgi:hypothetical protein